MKKSAFPIYVTGGPESGYHPGMTLREYYAGQVGLILMQKSLAVGSGFEIALKASTKDAIRWADALIAELEGGE